MAITKPPLHGAARKHRNHRAAVRYRCAPATPGKVYLPEDLASHLAWVQDLSAAGAGLLVDRVFDVGALITIHLKSSTTGEIFELSAQVAHCTQESGGNWVIGCAFEQKISEDVLDQLL